MKKKLNNLNKKTNNLYLMLKPFQYKQDNEDAIIVLHPETGKIIADDNLKDFLPIIKRNIP